MKKISSNSHLIIDKAINFNGEYKNTELTDGKIVLKEGFLDWSYESKEYDVLAFSEAVGSWNCITSKTQTAELQVSVCVNNKWSKFLSYGQWGLGKENYYYTTSQQFTVSRQEKILPPFPAQ